MPSQPSAQACSKIILLFRRLRSRHGADALQANKSGSASIQLRSRLAKARANAEKLLTTKQYSDAVLKAFGVAGWDS
jgi:hypothetical protein